MSTDAREPTWRGPCAGLADEDDDHVDDVQVHLLGRFQVHRDGREVPATAFGGRKVRALLRVLAVAAPAWCRTTCSPRPSGRTTCPRTPQATSTSWSTGC